MKRIILGSIFILGLLTSASFAQTAAPVADPEQRDFDHRQDREVKDFFQQQVVERGNFIATHQSIMDKQAAHAKLVLAGNKSAPDGLTDQERSDFNTFVQKQQGDKVAFFGRVGQEKETFSHTHSASAAPGSYAIPGLDTTTAPETNTRRENRQAAEAAATPAADTTAPAADTTAPATTP